MRWIAKSVVQNAVSFVPGHNEVNALLQRHVTKSSAVTRRFVLSKLAGVCAHHFEHYERFAGKWELGPEVLELGTGRVPIVPIGLFLAGASGVRTLDIEELLDQQGFEQSVELVLAAERDGSLRKECPFVRPERVARLGEAFAEEASPHETLASLGIRYEIRDTSASGLEGESVDLVVSNNTLEHVPVADLRSMMTELHRLLRPGGVMSHHVGIRDHFRRVDRSITNFNYLRFSPAAWAVLGSRLEFQNRLRESDYVRLFEEAGFRVAEVESIEGSLENLRSIRIASCFRDYSLHDLLVIDSWLAAVKDGAEAGASL